MAEVMTKQEMDLDKQASTNMKLDKMKVGQKWKVTINGVTDQAELFCVERTENPPTCRFTLMYFGVGTGKELIASKELNKWSFK